MINILQIVHSMPVAGTEKLVYDMMPLFEKKFSFSVLCLDELGILGEELHHQQKQIFCVHRQPGIDISVPRKIARICRQNKIDIIHCHQYTPYFYGCLSRIFFSSPKLIFTEHGRHYPDIVSTKRQCANQFLNLLTNTIVGVSQFPVESLVKKEKLPQKKMQVIYNGIDISRLNTRRPKKEMLHELGIAQEDKIVGFVGRIHPIKDPLMLLRAFCKVHKKCPQAKLIFVGDGEMMKECQEFVSQNNLEERAMFLGLRRDVLDIMQVFDVLVLSSLSEATSITLLEAMASGVAAACTRVGGNPEIVDDGTTGLLSERGNHHELAQNILRILTEANLKEKMGKSARKKVAELFTMEKMVANYSELYENLL
ncbi:GT4 family glycosyltransferase PelF [Candidatus Uabimicrobium amorphum]|uniref:Glycosyl transferase family 1 n=1 Tax=Uabimicrobium amorphum TaxID=2596890 RepID=A0A5S9F410_UABAM|nr:GT4 family glycosyltransferase PelF [Candidatus Uabimicrobium amorphum]BBM84811.1 glycosyl transferase family 1 [Candidatus Uabimicrobium amorphum]